MLSCVSFNGGGDAARIEEITNFPPEEMTFEFWAKSTEATAAGSLLSYCETESGDHFRILDTDDGLAIALNHSDPFPTNVAFHDTHWHHIALILYIGDKMLRLYKDGIEIFTHEVPAN